MKILFTTLITTIVSTTFAQTTSLDSTFEINGTPFMVVINQDQELYEPINSSLTIYKDGKIILTDSIFTTLIEVYLKDINLDGFQDLWIFQSTGARANETYNLYLYTESTAEFKKLVGFNDWPNVDTTSIRGVLSSTILMGCVSYHFIKLTNAGILIDLEIEETDCELNGSGYDLGLLKVKQLKD